MNETTPSLKASPVVLILLVAWTPPALGGETFGNFHTMGVVLDAPAGSASERIKQVRLYQLDGRAARRLLDPVQVHDYRYYATSVFGLAPDTPYRFRGEFIGEGGKVLRREEFAGRTRAESAAPPAAIREIHVAKSGRDSNPGTNAAPKRTLAAGLAAAVRPGTHVVVHEGVYLEGDLASSAKGSADAPIAVRAAKGESVVVDGSDPACLAAQWKDLGDGYFSTPYAGKTWLVCARDLRTDQVRRLYPVGSLANLRAKKAGNHAFATFGIQEAYHCAGSEIVVYCPYYQPGKITLHVAKRGGAVAHSNSRHVVYSDLTLRFFQGQVFYVNDSSDLTFRRCQFQHCNLPIAVKRASHRLLVERCRFLDDCARWGFLPKGMDDVGGYSAHIETGAVYVHNPYEGRGMVFRNNVIDGLFDGAHLTPMGPPSKVRTHETDFYNNRVVRVCDDLIEADGQCRNLRIFGNRMENFLSGVSIAQGYQGPTYVLYNVLAGCGNSTAAKLPPKFEGYPVKTNGGTRYGATGWAFFYHNTCHASPATNAFRVQEAKWRKLVLANNIWHGTRNGFVFWRDAISPIEMNGDLIHVEKGPLLQVRKRVYETKRQAQERLPFFSNSIVADPGFIKPAAGDFRLRAGSPAIDAGVVIPGVNDRDYHGDAPDIGAFEHRPTPN